MEEEGEDKAEVSGDEVEEEVDEDEEEDDDDDDDDEGDEEEDDDDVCCEAEASKLSSFRLFFALYFSIVFSSSSCAFLSCSIFSFCFTTSLFFSLTILFIADTLLATHLSFLLCCSFFAFASALLFSLASLLRIASLRLFSVSLFSTTASTADDTKNAARRRSAGCRGREGENKRERIRGTCVVMRERRAEEEGEEGRGMADLTEEGKRTLKVLVGGGWEEEVVCGAVGREGRRRVM